MESKYEGNQVGVVVIASPSIQRTELKGECVEE